MLNVFCAQRLTAGGMPRACARRWREATFVGVVNNQGIIGFAGEGHRNILRGNSATIQGGTISGAVPGTMTGTITTDSVTFEGGTVALGSWGWGGLNWTNVGHTTFRNVEIVGVTASFINRGTLVIEEDAVLSAGVQNENDGNLIVDGVWNLGAFTLASGGLSGSGFINGSIVNQGGIVAPGSSPGILHIAGNYSQNQNGILALEIGGLDPGLNHDQLVVAGSLSLSGEVQLSLIDGFIPSVGDKYNLFQVGRTFSIDNARFNWLNAPSGLTYDSAFVNGVYTVSITAVPEPSSMALASMAVAGMLFIRLKHHRGRLDRLGLRS